ncbi:MAG: glycosyltransferase family 2 protein [Actinomycetes bacterium]
MVGTRPKPNTESVCVILVNWNSWPDTVACLESCAALTYPNVEIVVVDNGSADDSVVRLGERFPDLRVVETGANLGFAAANNVGMRAALSGGAEYVWLLNNDTVVDPSALSELVDALRTDRGAGIACSRIYYLNEPNRLWFAGGCLSAWSGWALHRGVDQIDHGQYDEVEEVDFATGCSLLARAAAVAACGPMAEDYFLYWEDVEWCVRARRAGWRVVYAPRSRVWHKVGGSSADGSGRVHWRYEGRNRLRFYAKHRPWALGWVAPATLASALYLAARGRPGDGLALLQGSLDACRGRRGALRT